MDNQDIYNPPYSHIYVEKNIENHPRVRRILKRFADAKVVQIDHYKDIFNRKKQDFTVQRKSPVLILAEKKGKLIYEGAPVCQNFGNDYFYYTSMVMNCLYDCEYCYLKGMYPTANMVIFVNIEDYFDELKEMLEKHSVYLCVSYDTDLMSLENITGFVKEWIDFAVRHKNLKLEIRTKCGRKDLWDAYPPSENVIFAFTMSPQEVIGKYEHFTSNLSARVESAKKALDMGFCVRLCFDPMIYCKEWKKYYLEMLEIIDETIDYSDITDVSVGSFRISKDYLKNMRKALPDSPATQFPYENVGGFYQYPEKLRIEMENFLENELKKRVPAEKIFSWK